LKNSHQSEKDTKNQDKEKNIQKEKERNTFDNKIVTDKRENNTARAATASLGKNKFFT
jgi:hypothetical protein